MQSDRNLVYRATKEPKIMILSVSQIKAFLDSGLQRPYDVDNLRKLVNWWLEDTLAGYGVKQKWLLAYSISEWWTTLKSDIRHDYPMRVATDIRVLVEKISSTMEKNEGRARFLALKVHPGLCIKGQVYDVM